MSVFDLFAIILDDFFDEYNPWAGRREKSDSASRREATARDRFDVVRAKFERALVSNKERVVELGCKPESQSNLKMLPEVIIDMVFEYVSAKPPEAAAGTAVVPRRRRNNRARQSASTDDSPASTLKTAPFDMDSMYKPGAKHTIHLLDPNCHLTGPCWRDFSRYVKRFPGWSTKRIAATTTEKRRFGETRQGKVYFVKAVYTVPGTPRKKIKPAKTSTKRKREAACIAQVPAATQKPEEIAPNAPLTGPQQLPSTLFAASPRFFAPLPPTPLFLPNHPLPALSPYPMQPPPHANFPPPPSPMVNYCSRMEAARRAAGYALPGEILDSKPPAKRAKKTPK